MNEVVRLVDSETGLNLRVIAENAGSKSSLIEKFGIRGLYGNTDISLQSEFAATILIARNGTGKTTLLGALDAFLKLQFFRLTGLEFREIFCKLRGVDEELILTSNDLINFMKLPETKDFNRIIARTNVEPQRLFEFLINDYNKSLDTYYEDHNTKSLVNVLVSAMSGDLERTREGCQQAFISIFLRDPKIALLYSAITKELSEYEIVYLPTYRRIELTLNDDGASSNWGFRRRRPKLSISTSGLHTGDMEFGLRDISDRLSQLNTQISTRSNTAYREVSQNIINELIRGYEEQENIEIPKADELKLFFSRLESNSQIFGPYYPISAPDFNLIYSADGVPEESRKFLNYFLGQLNNIIKISKEIEEPVHDFIKNCNRYLSSEEPNTNYISDKSEKNTVITDGKALKMDRTDLSVHVESLPSGKQISLDTLSSGEKQMVSLFARMYLYPKRKIVLIDEPELSLSIDWQRGILVDVLLSPQCEQVIAITHSPFVFDNGLEPYARSLVVSFNDNPQN